MAQIFPLPLNILNAALLFHGAVEFLEFTSTFTSNHMSIAIYRAIPLQQKA